MRFVPYNELDGSPNIVVDGAAGPGTVLTLSHWPHSGTPTELKRDTSAEIVFAYLDSPQSRALADIVSNNHFDEDGLIGLYALLNPEIAQRHRALLIDIASAGDFGVYYIQDASRIAFAINCYVDRTQSPLPPEVFELPYPQMSGRLYKSLLEVLPDMIANPNGYRKFWQDDAEKLALSEKLIDDGQIVIEERPMADLAVVRIPETLSLLTARPLRQGGFIGCHLMALHSRTQCTRMLIVRGRYVEFQYRYESWVQLVSRRPPARVDLKGLAEELNHQEASGGHWVFDGVEEITPRLHLEGSATTTIPPEQIQNRLEFHLQNGPPAWNPYDPES